MIGRGGGTTHKVDSDGGDVAFRIGVVSEPEEQAGLSDARVSDEQELKEVVVSVVHGFGKLDELGWRK